MQTKRLITALGGVDTVAGRLAAIGECTRRGLVDNWIERDRISGRGMSALLFLLDSGGSAALREVIPLLGLPPGHERRAEVDRLLGAIERDGAVLPARPSTSRSIDTACVATSRSIDTACVATGRS